MHSLTSPDDKKKLVYDSIVMQISSGLFHGASSQVDHAVELMECNPVQCWLVSLNLIDSY
jgi:hypothetical protein